MAKDKSKGSGKGNNVQKAAPVAKPQKPAKVKGAVPASYAQKNPTLTTKSHAEIVADTNRKIKIDLHRWQDLADGIHGSYFIGIRDSESPVGMWLTTKSRQGRHAEIEVIENEDGIFIPRIWLFQKDDVTKSFHGDPAKADVQKRMLDFMKEVLAEEIANSKAEYLQQFFRTPADTVAVSAPAKPQPNPAQFKSQESVGSAVKDDSPCARIESFDLSGSVTLTPSILRMKVKVEGLAFLCHVGFADKRIYFLREKVGGAQKITLVAADDDELLMQIEDTHPQGVTVDVAVVMNGQRHPLNKVDISDMRNARMHIVAWLQNHFGLGQQSAVQAEQKGESLSA